METNETLTQLFDLMDEGLDHYLIANRDVIDPVRLLADIQAHKSSQEYVMLYRKTDLSALSEISPYAVKIKATDALVQQYEANTTSGKHWTGLIVSVEKETLFDTLLTHLRQRLMVLFSVEKKGILHFTNPTTAHYFLGECTELTDTGRWLGPIKQISWYGPKNSPYFGEWCTVKNAEEPEKTEDTDTRWLITQSQETALEIQYLDHALSQYFSTAKHKAENHQQWFIYRRLFNEATEIGFTEQQDQHRYLSLCGEYSFIQNSDYDLEDNFKTVYVKVTNSDSVTESETQQSEDKTKPLTAHLSVDKKFQMLSQSDKLAHIETLLNKDTSYANGQ